MIPAVAITAIGQSMLVCHYFISEEELLKTKPWVRRWERETFDERHIRYHSKKAIKYWDNHQKLSDKIVSLAIYYADGKEIKRVYH